MSKEDQTKLDWLLKVDSIFLRNHNLMDYSLLLVIETDYTSLANPALNETKSTISSKQPSSSFSYPLDNKVGDDSSMRSSDFIMDDPYSHWAFNSISRNKISSSSKHPCKYFTRSRE